VTGCVISSARLDGHRQWRVDLDYGGGDTLPPADPANVRLEGPGYHHQLTRDAQYEHQEAVRGAAARLRPIMGRYAAAGDPRPTTPTRRSADLLRAMTLTHRAVALRRSLPVTAPLGAAQVGWTRGSLIIQRLQLDSAGNDTSMVCRTRFTSPNEGVQVGRP